MLTLEEFVLFAFTDISFQTTALGAQGNQLQHPVAPVDVQKFCDRAEVVSGIVIAVSGKIIAQTVVAILHTSADLTAQIVAVRTVAVYHLAQFAHTGQFGGEKFPFAIAAIFQEHEGNLGFLPCMDQMPAIFDAVGTAYFQTGDLTGPHRFHSQGNVCLPGSGDDNKLHIIICQQVAVIGIAGRCISPLFCDKLGGRFCPVGITVAHSHNIYIREMMKHIAEQYSATLAKTNKTQF